MLSQAWSWSKLFEKVISSWQKIPQIGKVQMFESTMLFLDFSFQDPTLVGALAPVHCAQQVQHALTQLEQ